MLEIVPKSRSEIVSALAESTLLFILGCEGQSGICDTHWKAQVAELPRDLFAQGKVVVGTATVARLCDGDLASWQLGRNRNALDHAEAVLVVSCGVGVQAATKVLSKRCHPAANTFAAGGPPGFWHRGLACAACGNCHLSYTGGICPITTCPKAMLNGPCAGYRDGRCEHLPLAQACGWLLIYDRLKALGRTDLLLKIPELRDHSQARRPSDLRPGALHGLETSSGASPSEEVTR